MGELSIGALLRKLRVEAGRSQSEQADLLSDRAGRSVTRNEVSRWENEARLLTPYWQGHHAANFGVPAADLRRAVTASKARRRRDKQSERDIDLFPPLVTDHLTFLSRAALVVPGEQGDLMYDQLTKFLRQLAGTMNRRELFQLFGWAVTTVAASPAMSGLDDGEQERLACAIVAPSRVDTRVIDRLATILRDCKQQDDVLGPRAVLHTVLAQRQLVRHLLTECPAPLRPRLLAVYSGMSSSVGDYFFDLNDLDSAGYYYDQARAAAHDARSTELSIYALCSMSYAASLQGKAHVGIDLAAAAQSLATKTDDQLIRICAAERAGTAYAIDGQHKSCLIEFDKAQEVLLSVTDAPPTSPAYYYHEGLLASHQSECLLLLEKPKEAAISASTGLTVFNKSYVDGYALCTLNLSNAFLHIGEIDEAVQVVGSVVGLAAQNRQPRLVKELRSIRTRMQPWHGTQAVQALDEQLVEAGFGA